jgi:hypothetical protein
MAVCGAACITAPPALVAAMVTMPAAEGVRSLWHVSSVMLHGLSRPPDPFPPRA